MTAGIQLHDVVILFGPILAAAVAVGLAVRSYRKQQQEARRQERAELYAEALRAVEDYQEAPYRIMRRDGSATARRELTEALSDIKSRISFYSGWMSINASQSVAEAYEAYVLAAKLEAGLQMTQAWRGRPTKRDADVPIGRSLPRKQANAAREVALSRIRADLNPEA